MKKLLLLALLPIMVMSCKKKETPAPEPAPTPVTPTKKVISGTVENENGIYFATISFLYVAGQWDAGLVVLNTTTVGTGGNYTYYSPSPSVTINNPLVWKIQGGTSGVPTQTITIKDVPVMPISADVDTSKTINANQPYTITHQAIDCDSIEYRISSNRFKKTAGNNTSVTFTSAELTGMGYAIDVGNIKKVSVAVIAYNVTIQTADYKSKVFMSRAKLVQFLKYNP